MHHTEKNKLIYYSHSINLYNTETERKDLEYLSRKGEVEVVNPNGLGLGSDMIKYILQVEKCDEVWYRGNTSGVAFEVLSALAMGKPVYSLETKNTVKQQDRIALIYVFRMSYYHEHNVATLKKVLPKYYNKFLKVLSELKGRW